MKSRALAGKSSPLNAASRMTFAGVQSKLAYFFNLIPDAYFCPKNIGTRLPKKYQQ